MPNIKTLIEKRANAWEQMQGIRADAEREGRDQFTAEERQKWDAAMTDLESLNGDIERLERESELARKYARRDAIDAGAPGETRQGTTGDRDAEYREAFDLYLRTGEQTSVLREGFNSMQELRALGVATGAAGGYSVPSLFRDVLIERLKYYNAVRQVADHIETDTGQALPWPTNDDTANVGAILGENTQITQQDVTFGSAQLSAYMYTSKLVLVSLQLLQDNAINLDQRIPDLLARRIGRAQNQHFTTGTGSGQPLGVITGNTTNVSTQAATGKTTQLVYTDLVAAMNNVDAAYLMGNNCKWMLSQKGLAAAMSIVDNQNRPLWQPSLQAGVPSTLLGFEYVLNNDLAAPAAGALIGAFGDFKAGYVVRDVTGVQLMRLNERYADFLQVGFLGFERSDGTVQDPYAYTVLKQAAS